MRLEMLNWILGNFVVVSWFTQLVNKVSRQWYWDCTVWLSEGKISMKWKCQLVWRIQLTSEQLKDCSKPRKYCKWDIPLFKCRKYVGYKLSFTKTPNQWSSTDTVGWGANNNSSGKLWRRSEQSSLRTHWENSEFRAVLIMVGRPLVICQVWSKKGINRETWLENDTFKVASYQSKRIQ